MARIIEKPGTKTVDTYCEHMALKVGGDLPLPPLGILYDYCPICGQKLHGEEPTIDRVCSDCGRPVVQTIKQNPEINSSYQYTQPSYCTFCGEKFEPQIETAYIKQPATGSGFV